MAGMKWCSSSQSMRGDAEGREESVSSAEAAGRARAQEEAVDAWSRYVALPAAEYILRGPRNALTIGE